MGDLRLGGLIHDFTVNHHFLRVLFECSRQGSPLLLPGVAVCSRLRSYLNGGVILDQLDFVMGEFVINAHAI